VSIHVALKHVTHYRYDRLVELSPQVVRLRPAPHCRTPILSYSLSVEPETHFINWQQDPFANYLARLVFPEKTREFKITVDLHAEMSVYNPFDFFLEPDAEQFPFLYEAGLKHELAPYRVKGSLADAPAFKTFIAKVDVSKRRTIDFLVGLNQLIQKEVRYLIRMEPGVQTPEQTLVRGEGSCRDSGWLMVETLRQLGLAARFVSGYLIQLKADVKALDGPSGAEADFTDLHAWCEVYLPGAGWIGLDPTSGLFAGEGHIPLACTPEPGSAAPVTGVVEACEVEFTHVMEVTRIHESPRVTLPYTPGQWQEVLALGDAVDEDLLEYDVRLTQGGEPTFVSVDDRDGAEWNISALGPTKRGFAVALLQQLSDHYGASGFLHFGQGKWYPGEQLPRWALTAYWRADGQPCWNKPALIADERTPLGHDASDAKRFIEALTLRLGLDQRYVLPGYEDSFYYLWRERRLPVNVEASRSKLEDKLEAERLRKIFEATLDNVVGYVLPLNSRRNGPDDADLKGASPWVSSKWVFRNARMFLFPGDSPMGYRLPLDSLPWVAPAEAEVVHQIDPYAPRRPLPPASAVLARKPAGEYEDDRKTVPAKAAANVSRLALCVEARKGVLYVFLPPLPWLEDYLELVGQIEATAAALKMPVALEGYPAPRDARIKLLQVTPDPGVIEVNIHPASNWKDLVEHTEFLYDTAHQTRLSSEKFMLDGRHTGTGGGNHFVLGGATPADSPFLRRPDLLVSLISYWHNHPSLSYLFSGMFIGPTSQAPRVDEARNDQVYELEIAFAEIRKQQAVHGEKVPPWMVDRALRNILIDVTGNTHRSEFCIDKLYSPDGPTGRLGLLELRAFEMPPHARMSLVQQLLLRALVARFWRSPYVTPLTRWGTSLHDRFLLPSMVQLDFEDVIAELNAAGYAFDPAWFAPHFEFRFPLYGEIAVNAIQFKLRAALEPWHVLGEESTSTGTARYVDSSVERLEVLVSGMNGQRYVVTANGRPLPLHPTGREGEYVCGVRYRAWAPPSALHPTIGTHMPMVFDIVDTWMECSLGGCQYHVAHPGGLSYDTFPVNAYEAESRRLARFIKMGHTAGRMKVSGAAPGHAFPFTLDMRT